MAKNLTQKILEAHLVEGELITDPRDLRKEMDYPHIKDPDTYLFDDNAIISPAERLREVEVIRGPNIKPLPDMDPLPETLTCDVGITVGDNISTDTIMPAGTRVLPLRSNIEAISEILSWPGAP
jgi:aconitate hydratase